MRWMPAGHQQPHNLFEFGILDQHFDQQGQFQIL